MKTPNPADGPPPAEPRPDRAEMKRHAGRKQKTVSSWKRKGTQRGREKGDNYRRELGRRESRIKKGREERTRGREKKGYVTRLSAHGKGKGHREREREGRQV